jgi:hypothetical protein
VVVFLDEGRSIGVDARQSPSTSFSNHVVGAVVLVAGVFCVSTWRFMSFFSVRSP